MRARKDVYRRTRRFLRLAAAAKSDTGRWAYGTLAGRAARLQVTDASTPLFREVMLRNPRADQARGLAVRDRERLRDLSPHIPVKYGALFRAARPGDVLRFRVWDQPPQAERRIVGVHWRIVGVRSYPVRALVVA